MIVAIVGHVRKLPTESFTEQYDRIQSMIEQAVVDSGFSITQVACGRKNGVDRAALRFAKAHNIPAKHFAIRFSVIQCAEALIAFRDGSQSTREVIEQMSRDGKLVHIVQPSTKPPTTAP